MTTRKTVTKKKVAVKKVAVKKVAVKKVAVKKAVVKKAVKKKTDIIELINQVKTKKVRGFVFVATFNKEPGSADIVNSVSNKISRAEFSALVASIAQSADLGREVAKMIVTDLIKG